MWLHTWEKEAYICAVIYMGNRCHICVCVHIGNTRHIHVQIYVGIHGEHEAYMCGYIWGIGRFYVWVLSIYVGKHWG